MVAKLSSQYWFVVEPDAKLKCAICQSVPEDPLEHRECGKLFCKECIEEHGKDEPCPHCKTQGRTRSQLSISSRIMQMNTCIKTAQTMTMRASTVERKAHTLTGTTQVHDAQCDLKLVMCPACSAIIATI